MVFSARGRQTIPSLNTPDKIALEKEKLKEIKYKNCLMVGGVESLRLS